MAAAPRPGSSAKGAVLLRPQTAREGTMAEPVGFVGVGRMGAPTLVAEATVNAWRIAVAQGYGDQDITAIARLYGRWAGVEIREKGGGR